MLWDKKHIEFDVPQNVTKKLEFNYIGDKEILSAKTSCGCSAPSFTSKKVSVNFTPQIRNVEYKKPIRITVVFKDKTVDKLSFTANVKINDKTS